MRILIVEDEKEIADGINIILKNAGYEVDVVYNGLDGLDYILSDIYDLILLDIMLPKINGIDVLKNARAEGITTPVIMLTAKFQPEDKINGLDSGADDYLTKPFDAGELLARIRTRTRKSNTIASDKIEVYDISGKKLDLSVCKEEIKVMKYIGDVEELNIDLTKELSNQGIDAFNRNDKFFNVYKLGKIKEKEQIHKCICNIDNDQDLLTRVCEIDKKNAGLSKPRTYSKNKNIKEPHAYSDFEVRLLFGDFDRNSHKDLIFINKEGKIIKYHFNKKKNGKISPILSVQWI